MNVEHKCPECQHRAFLPPGNPYHVPCYFHPGVFYEQTEFSPAPNFAFKDEGEVDPHKTGVLTTGVQRGAVTIVRDRPPEVMTEDMMLTFMREQYERVTGEKVDLRWGLKRLKEEIEKCEFDTAYRLDHIALQGRYTQLTGEAPLESWDNDRLALEIHEAEEKQEREDLEERLRELNNGSDSKTD